MNLSPLPIQKFFDNNGKPLDGGLLFTYASGTTTKIATYKDQAGTSNTNPIVLDFRGEANVWLDPTLTYKFTLAPAGDTDPPTKPIWTVDNISAAVTYASLTAQIIGQILWPRQANESSAGVTPTNYGVNYPNWVNAQRYGILADGTTNDTTAFINALNASDETISSAQGNQLDIAQGTSILSSTLNIPNRVAIRGRNKRGSALKADASHPGPYMFTVINGTSSMFDNPLDRITLDCNDVAGLGGVISDAWQEGGGLRDVLINKFRTFGVKFQSGFGGASFCVIRDSEIFGSASNATAGIYCDISASAAFMLHVESTSIVGGGATTASLTRGIHMIGASLTAINVHFEVLGSGIYLDGSGNHVLINCTGAAAASAIDNLVEIAGTFTGTLTMIGCFRNGATNFLKDNRAGGYGTIPGFDLPFLHINASLSLAPAFNGGVWSGGVFDGTPAGPGMTVVNGLNVTSVTKNGTGDWTVVETRARGATNCAPGFSTNNANASCRVDLVGTNSYRLRHYVGGVLTDSNEIKFWNVRLG